MSDRSLRIGIDIRYPDPVESGQQRYLWRLGRWLGGRDHEVHFLCLKGVPERVDPGAATLHDLEGASRPTLAARIRELELDALLLNPERSRTYRGIEANVLRPGYGTDHYSQKLRSFRTPIRSLARTALRVAPWVLMERRWERAFYEGASVHPEIIAVSRYMKDEILASYQVDPDRIHVVYNGVDPTEFNPERRVALREEQRATWAIPEGAFCLLFMGHNFRLKGLWQLLDTTARLREEAPGTEPFLVVAGRGTGRTQRRRAEKAVSRLGLEDRVRLVGIVHPAIRAFAAADAFVHLSWHDSFGFVSLEAMASGLPVITTPFVGASEIIEDGRSGLVIDPRRDGAIDGAIRSLNDPGRRRELGKAAAEEGARHPEEKNFQRVEAIVRRAAERTETPVR